MLSRRSFLGSATALGSGAALAAGCSTLGTPVTPPGAPQETEINVAAYTRYISLAGPLDTGSPLAGPKDKYWNAIAALEDDKENPFGPARARYRPVLKFYEEIEVPAEPPKTAAEREVYWDLALSATAELLDTLDADLVTVWPEEARFWGEKGLLLPLERFSSPEETDFSLDFHEPILNQYRKNGQLYALPVDARPLMLYYDEDYFASRGVPPPDAGWTWDTLVENAERLTARREDGAVARWGLEAHGNRIFWALWQNEAAVVDMELLQCRIHEPAAVEALQFVHDLIHEHRVSPAVNYLDLWNLMNRSPAAMLYDLVPAFPNDRKQFRLAPLPQGRAPAVPLRTGFGIGIAARSQRAETAYAALKGLIYAVQSQMYIPASRSGVAGLQDHRTELRPEEVAAVQYSLEHGREWPQFGLQLHAMDAITQGLVRGDDVQTIVNDTCSLVHEYKETGKLPYPEE